MNKLLLNIIFSIILFVNFSNAGIELKSECVINSKIIKLSDLVINPENNGALPDISFGNAPLPGESKYIDKNYIIFKLGIYKNNGLNFSDSFIVPEQIKIISSYKELNTGEIKEAIKEHITSLIKDEYERFKIDIIKIRNKELKLPASEEIRYKVRLNNKSELKGRVIGFIDIIVENKVYKSLNFQVNISAWKSLLLAKKNIEFNEILSAENVEKHLIEVTKLNLNNIVTDDTGIISKTVKRRIYKNEILRLNDIKEQSAVKYGEIIDVLVEKNGFSLKTKAKALENGAIGDKIRLLNLESKKSFFAKISNVNEATIR